MNEADTQLISVVVSLKRPRPLMRPLYHISIRKHIYLTQHTHIFYEQTLSFKYIKWISKQL